MADGGDAAQNRIAPAGIGPGSSGGAEASDRIVSDALQGLRVVAAELRSDALESRGAHLDPARVLEAARRVERLSTEILHALGLVAPEPQTPLAASRRPLARPRILVVDDDPDLREMMRLVLEPGYEVLCAADGEASLDVARTDQPDLIIMDQFMPRLDGLGALERLRADPATEDIPVILVSARADESVRVRGLDLGAVDFLAKPFSELELRARLDRTLRLVRSQSVLRELAQTDPLTGLANLRAFRARLVEEVKRARRYRDPLTCVMADMDHLKAINDQLGHAAGDLAISAVARVVAEELRETDFGARYGGDEFVLLLPHTAREEGRVFAERLCARLHATPLQMSGRRILIGVSFGVAELADANHGDAGEELLRSADAALYDAKHAGRGRVAVAAEPS
ncbi:MAG TPA: diguanylate cyclase [Anaeromyxobacteraceae bacterium]|nr:diguanylate cyclase [Anaeromyxobacteraceae bacterium]